MLSYMATYIGKLYRTFPCSWHGNEALTAGKAPTCIGVSSIPLRHLETPKTARKIVVHPTRIENCHGVFQYGLGDRVFPSWRLKEQGLRDQQNPDGYLRSIGL